MFESIISNGILFYVIAGICAVGVLSSLMLGILYGKFARDSINMASPKTKLMKQLKAKFENSYKINENINNVEVFVEKWVQKYKVLGMSLHKIKRASFYAMALSLVLSGVGVYYAWDLGYSLDIQINYIGAGVASLLLLIAVRGIGDYRYKTNVMLVNVRDYLENSLLNRVKVESEGNNLMRRQREKESPQEQSRSRPPIKEVQAPTESVREMAATGQERAEPVRHHVEEVPRRREGRETPTFSERIEEKINERKVQEDIARMKQSMNEIAASNPDQKQSNKEILKDMDPKRQEEVIREILKEFLS